MPSDRKRRTPWGSWQVLAKGSGFQVKRLVVNPGHRFSLQYHRHRSEHWIAVAGTGRAICGAKTVKVAPGQTLFIPTRAKHRLHNTATTPLVIIEVQRGSYLGEDDIVRIQDDYARA